MNSENTPEISVVIPMLNEEGNAEAVIADVLAALKERAIEVIPVDDGSRDETGAALARIAASDPRVRPQAHELCCGQSEAIRTGVFAARGTIVATLDGDGQNPPENLPKMIAVFEASGPNLGLVQGQRVKRQDTAWKRCGSILANKIRKALLQDGVRDSGCGLKIFPRSVYMRLPFFAHLHRYMPAIVKREGFDVVVCDVSHAARRAGTSNYGNWSRAWAGVYDLLGVLWLIRRRPKNRTRHPQLKGQRPTVAQQPINRLEATNGIETTSRHESTNSRESRNGRETTNGL